MATQNSNRVIHASSSSSLSSNIINNNTHQELKKAIATLLAFFTDDRGKNLLRSFAALSQSYVDLRTTSLHGVSTNGTMMNSNVHNEQEGENESEGKRMDVEKDGFDESSYSIVYDPASIKISQTASKLKSIAERVETIISASTSLLTELLQLLGRVKELSHATFVAANNFQSQHQQQNTINNKSTSSFSSSVHLLLLKDVLETLVNKQLQNKIVTIHVIFNEVTSAAKIGLETRRSRTTEHEIISPSSSMTSSSLSSSLPPLEWKLSIDQLRVYQTALSAAFNELSSAASGVAATAAVHPLESVPSLVDRIGILCSKIFVVA